MKISREEFKEFVCMYKEIGEMFEQYADIIDSNLLSQMMFPALEWVEEKLGLCDENVGNTIGELVSGVWGSNYSPFLDDNGEMTKDLDLIYDKYIEPQNKD